MEAILDFENMPFPDLAAIFAVMALADRGIMPEFIWQQIELFREGSGLSCEEVCRGIARGDLMVWASTAKIEFIIPPREAV